MSHSDVQIALPPDVPPLSAEVLNRMARAYFSRGGKEILQSDVERMTGWPGFVVLRIFLYLQQRSLARVQLGVYHRETGAFIGSYPYAGGRPRLPLEVDDEEGRFTVSSEDELEYEVSAVILAPVRFQNWSQP